jgi:hypothetical protein
MSALFGASKTRSRQRCPTGETDYQRTCVRPAALPELPYRRTIMTNPTHAVPKIVAVSFSGTTLRVLISHREITVIERVDGQP